MKYSIIIPTKDRPDFLKACLESIRKQIGSRDDIEVIVVDDGSEAGKSIENQMICKHGNAIYLKHEYNRKMAVARNTGASVACGKWVIFLDDDVIINENWIDRLIELTDSITGEVVGIEGKVIPSGNGIWDREVSNLKGGAYLTCHLIIRKDIFDKLSGFDPEFEYLGPFCEDHEFATRALWMGKIIFDNALSVTHLPRKINLIKFLMKSPERIKGLLKAEFYFYCKHPDRYHMFRSSRTFWGTYLKIVTRNIYTDIRRRQTQTLLKHPLQAFTMMKASLIEQIEAVLLLPYFIKCRSDENNRIYKDIDIKRTTKLWQFKKDNVSSLKLKSDYFRSITFKYSHAPDDSITRFLKESDYFSTLPDCKVLLRVDDVFLDKPKAVSIFSEMMKEKKIRYLTAVKGDDIKLDENGWLIDKLIESGAEIGIHGFTHKGNFGPFNSELMQLKYPEIDSKVKETFSCLNGKKINCRILVPPFNAIGPEQIRVLSTSFDVICGGPETMRFSGRIAGAAAITGGGWYIPSLFPFYSDSEVMLDSGLDKKIGRIRGLYCITVHFSNEEKDGFSSLSKLIDKINVPIISWEIFKRDLER
jgi:glycosyltransferase involved in cell wall biosynthesis